MCSRRGSLLVAHGNSELYKQRALLRRAHGAHVHRRGRHGRGRGKELVVRSGSSSRSVGDLCRRTGTVAVTCGARGNQGAVREC